MFVIHCERLGGYVLKTGGWNLPVRSPWDATKFETREEALAARPGHGREMGGSGYHGTVHKL